MKKLITVMSVLMMGISVFAQTPSPFVKKPWKEIVAMAKKQNKAIFVQVGHVGRLQADSLKDQDRFDKEVFTDEAVRSVLDKNFIATRMNPFNDAEFEEFSPLLDGSSYPCYMMLYPNGAKLEVIYEPSSAIDDKKSFIAALQRAADKADVKRKNTRRITFQNMSFEDAKKKAKAENKLIFIDGMFEGCHWCTEMENDTFTLDEVADFYNNNFICLQIDFIKDKKIAAAYKTKGFPAYFYIDGNGKQLFYESGYTKDGQKFIGYGQTAMKGMEKK